MQRKSAGWSRAAEWYAAGLFLLYAAMLFAHRSPPGLADLSNWTYQGVLLREHLLGHPDAAHLLKRYPVPNSTVTVGIGLLTLVLPWKLAVKVWLCLHLGFCFGAMRHLLRTLQSTWVGWVVLPQAVFLNVNFWYGFLNFELGLGCVLLTVSLLLRRVRGATGRGWTLPSVLLFAFFTHMIAFAFCGLLLVLYVAQTKRVRTLWQLAPTAALSVWYVLGRYVSAGDADGQAGMEASVRNYSAAFWALKGNSYLKSFGFVNPESVDSWVFGRAGFLLLFMANAVLAGVVLWTAARLLRRGLRAGSEERFVWLAVVALVPLFLLAPGAALGVSDPGARLLQVALAVVLALCCRAGSRPMRAGAGCSALLALAGIVLFARFGFKSGFDRHLEGTMPAHLDRFARVPNDQVEFYRALDAGDLSRPVFPTGLFLNRPR